MKRILDWAKGRKSNVFLHTVQSDRNTLEVLELTNDYLKNNKEIWDKINEALWVYRAAFDLLPQTLENITSGHGFPINEGEYELDSSIQLCKLGFYKHAIIALRNALELGILSVYWDRDGNSHMNIPKWLSSGEPTPFRDKVTKALKKNKRIEVFDKQHNIFREIKNLYGELSDFSHTKGMHFSSLELTESNANTFNGSSVRKWLEFLERVVKVIITLHILQYPVGLQNIDLFRKYGLNPPAGGFLEQHQADSIRTFLGREVAETLQTISDADPIASYIAQQINDMPDLTDEEIGAHVEKQEKISIQLHQLGYQGWIRNYKKMYRNERRTSPIKYITRVMHWRKLKKWAKENGCYDKPSKHLHL